LVSKQQSYPFAKRVGNLAEAKTTGYVNLRKLHDAVAGFLKEVDDGVRASGEVPAHRQELACSLVTTDVCAQMAYQIMVLESSVQDGSLGEAVPASLLNECGLKVGAALAHATMECAHLLAHDYLLRPGEKPELLRYWGNVSAAVSAFHDSFFLGRNLRAAWVAIGFVHLGPMPEALRRRMPLACMVPVEAAGPEGRDDSTQDSGRLDQSRAEELAALVASEHASRVAAAPMLRPGRLPPATQLAGTVHSRRMLAAAGLGAPLMRPRFSGPVQPYIPPVRGRVWDDAQEGEVEDLHAHLRQKLRERHRGLPSDDAATTGKRRRKDGASHAVSAAASQGVQHPAAAGRRAFGLFSGPPRTLAHPAGPARQPAVYATVADASVQIRASLDRADARALQETREAEAFWASPRGRARAVAVCDTMGDDELEGLMKDDERCLQRASPREVVARSVLQGEAVRAMNRRLSDAELEAWAQRERDESSARRESAARRREPEPYVPLNLVRLVRIRPKVRAAYVYAALRARRRLADQTIIALTGPARVPVAPRALAPVPSGTKIQW